MIAGLERAIWKDSAVRDSLSQPNRPAAFRETRALSLREGNNTPELRHKGSHRGQSAILKYIGSESREARSAAQQ